MALLKPEDLDKVRRKNVANILSKQAAGGTLTAREERILVEAAGGLTPDSSAGNFVATYDQLADRLGISRRGLAKVRARYPDHLPAPRPDGRHDVTAWAEFFRTHGIHGAAIDAEPPGPDDELLTTSESEWRKRELREKVRKLQLLNSLTERSQVPISEITEKLPVFLMALRKDIDQLVHDLTNDLEGIDDFHEREDLIQSRVNQLLSLLAGCPFLDDAAESPSTTPPAPAPPRATRKKRRPAKKTKKA